MEVILQKFFVGLKPKSPKIVLDHTLLVIHVSGVPCMNMNKRGLIVEMMQYSAQKKSIVEAL